MAYCQKLPFDGASGSIMMDAVRMILPPRLSESRTAPRVTAVALAANLILFPLISTASGSYRHSGLPLTGSEPMEEGLDVGRFELGRRLYAGMLRLPESDTQAVSHQRERILMLVRRLPKSQARPAERISEFAGRLTEIQLGALEYFVQERFSRSSEKGISQ